MAKYQVIVEFRALYPDAKKPEYQTEGASGMDLHAYVPRANGRAPEALRIPSLGRLLVGTGIALAIPPGYEGQIRPRSGFALKDGVTVLNSPGTIDSDYRGEIKVLLVNLGNSAVEIRTGERIAQLVIAPVARANLNGEPSQKTPATRGYQPSHMIKGGYQPPSSTNEKISPTSFPVGGSPPAATESTEKPRGDAGFGSTGKN